MKNSLKILGLFLAWCICALMLPFALVLFLFKPLFGIVSLGFFVFLLAGVPRIIKRSPPLVISVFATELLMLTLLTFYYTSDRRPAECGFQPEGRVKAILTYSGCMEMAAGADKRKDCLKIVDNPYDLALYGGRLYVVSGRDFTTLGELDPARPGEFKAYNLGFGNIQQIVSDPETGLAVLPAWKDRKIDLLDLNSKNLVKSFSTDVLKLIGARKSGDSVYVISELAKMYTVDLKNMTMTRRDLGYRFHTLYDIEVDHKRGAVFLSDWVWGLMYRMDEKNMETVKQRSLGIVATGMALDEERCELFVSRPLVSELAVLDCETMETKRHIPAGFSVHEIALSGDGKKIYAVRYMNGKFRIIDRANGDIIDEAHIGGQTRALLYDRENNRIFAATKCGIFEIIP